MFCDSRLRDFSKYPDPLGDSRTFATIDKKSPEAPVSEKGGVWMALDDLRWVHASICLVLCDPVIPVAQVCLVLSVPENGSDWQLTQIGLKRSDLSRTLDRIETGYLEKSRVLVPFSDPFLNMFGVFFRNVALKT